MQRAERLELLREKLQGAALTALGLLVLALLFAFLVPRRDEIASHFDAVRAERQANVAEARPMEPPTEAEPPAAIAEASPASSTGTAAVADPAPATSTAAQEPAAAPADTPSPGTDGVSAKSDWRPELLARPVALDTGTLLVGQGKVRLEGVEPLPVTQKCGEGAEAWFCGSEARSRFRAWLRARSIRCPAPANFGTSPTEIVASCDLSGEDIGNWLIANGWARASADGPYAAAENAARTAKLGIWAERRRVE